MMEGEEGMGGDILTTRIAFNLHPPDYHKSTFLLMSKESIQTNSNPPASIRTPVSAEVMKYGNVFGLKPSYPDGSFSPNLQP